MAGPLTQLDQNWRAILESEGCPPILGLVPLSEDDCQRVSSVVQLALEKFSHQIPVKVLQELIIRYPAIMVLWLARKAGDAYDLGTFWENFEDAIGVRIHPVERPAVAELFRDTSSKVMGHYVAPREIGAFRYVATFLFQAGLPLCHCGRFAGLARQVERRFGLPDLESTEAGAELRDHILVCAGTLPVPMLKRALRGPAGPLICQAALRVIIEGDYQGISPALGQELARAFANQSGGQLRRSARQPFLRLGEDLTSLEVVGPRQDERIVGNSGLTWMVNGKSFAAPAFDEFVYPVRDQNPIRVDLRGLRGGVTASRSFVIRLPDREPPFIMFDQETRRAQRDEKGRVLLLPCGTYYLLHSQDYRLFPPCDKYDWADGERTLSSLEVHPDSEIRLTGSEDWVFRAAQDPFVEIRAQSLSTDDKLHIHYGWDNLPRVWIPAEAYRIRKDAWSLQVSSGELQYSCELPEGRSLSSMMCSEPEGKTFLNRLSPGLHELHISILYRQKRQFAQSQWLWIGLEAYRAGETFHLSASPQNLVPEDCLGFEIAPSVIRHSRDEYRQHRLAFDVGGVVKHFHWSQRGIFLESFEKTAGRRIEPAAHQLGATFSASTDSTRWLRVWCVPSMNVELLTNGRVSHRVSSVPDRALLDVSLAQLSAAYPDGGTVSLRWGDQETTIAKFARLLVPSKIQCIDTRDSQEMSFVFREDVNWTKLHISELVSGCVIASPGIPLDGPGSGVFSSEHYPEVKCGRVFNHENSEAGGVCTVSLRVPRRGWAPGIWFIELEVRRHGASDWQRITSLKGQRVPILVVAFNEQTDKQDLLFDILHAAYCKNDVDLQASLDHAEAAQHQHELLELLSQVLYIIHGGFAPEVQARFDWLEVLFNALGRHLGKGLLRSNQEVATRLLNLAAYEGDVSGAVEPLLKRPSLFVTIPSLLALSAEHYSQVSTTHQLGRALQWCGRISSSDFVFEAFRDLIDQVFRDSKLSPPDIFTTLRHFQNFAQVVQASEGALDTTDFSHFDYARYITHTIGRIEVVEPQPEWEADIALGRAHALWALGQLGARLAEAPDNPELGAVNALLSKAPLLRGWLRQALDSHYRIMPHDRWNEPWLSFTVPEHDFMGNCVQFSSVFALAARACGSGWLEFDDLMGFLLRQAHGVPKSEKTLASLVSLAPELLGFYLMFWELMIRTYPHE